MEINKQKIIALSCSPSKGRNSDTMLDHFIIGAKRIDNIEIEKIYLNDILIDQYKFENGNGPGVHEKEFNDLCMKIKYSTGLVISTPTYNFSVPAQLKNFIDRIRFIALDINNKNSLGQPTGTLGHVRTYYLVSGGTPRWAQRILFFAFPPFWLRSVFLYYGAHCLGAKYTGDVRAFQNEKILKQHRKLGQRFARHIMKGSKNRILERIFWRPPQTD